MAAEKVTVMTIYNNERLVSFFRAFLSKNLGVENWRLFSEIQDFRQLYKNADVDANLTRTTAWVIYKEYLQPDATYEVPVPFHIRKEVFQKITSAKVDPEIFDEVEVEVVLTLQNECIPKFLASELYERYTNQSSGEPDVVELPNMVRRASIRRSRDDFAKLSNSISKEREMFEHIAKLEGDYLYKVRFIRQFLVPEIEEKGELSAADSALLFGNVKELYELHEHIQKELLPDTSLSRVIQRAIFERHFVDIYRKYLTNVPFAKLLLSSRMDGSSKFKRIVNKLETVCQNKFKETIQFLLFDMHIELLRSYHESMRFLQQSIGALSGTDVLQQVGNILAGLLAIEKAMTADQRVRVLFRLRECIINYPGNLAKHDREFVMEGGLEIQENDGSYVKYYFFLFNDKLVCTEPLGKDKFKFVTFYPLINASLESDDGTKFIIFSGLSEERLKAPSNEKKTEWTMAINSVITEWKTLQKNQSIDKERRLLNIAIKMKSSISVKDRGGVFKSHKDSFLGSDAVFHLIENVEGVNNREEAEAIANQLLQKGMIISCSGDTTFQSRTGYYRFGELKI